MIRAGVNDPENPLILMGLSEENVARLKDGHPIRTPIRSYGIDLPGTIAVIYGKTEADIEAMLRENGLISERTEATADPKADRHHAVKRDNAHILICTVGLPRSGKTTWARSQSYPVVNPDSIRLAMHGQRFAANAEPFVWASAKLMVRSLFLAGHQTVILDATNTTAKRRDEWKSSEWATFFKPIDTPKDECVRRADDDAEIIPVIERMAGSFDPLGEDDLVW